ncbi:MAG: ShlB/FhaC/HecB family hemolysin secretion/activation protein [Candidatus Thermoplasmatota archaeon]|nr:ShlB/FhaC/HecB family hemolysin secretion/activation protein [Candidatus Thermoplasmatota archaeon]
MRAFLTVLFHFLPLSAAFLFASAHAADDGRFDLFEIRVEGNTVLPALLIERAVYPSLGEKKGIQDVEAARAALEKLYQDNGYLTVLVDIPEQEVKNGVVRLRVTEGRVERLRVTGSRYFSLGRIREKTPDLAEGSVPYFPDVQKQLAAVNRGGDRRVTPVLRPGRSPGKVEVDLKVDDRLPLHGSVELNDRYSANTTRTRLNANMRYDNLWQREHSLSLGVQTAPQEPAESTVFSATYVWPTDKGNYLAAYGVISESDVAALGDVNVIGKGRIAGLRYIVPLRARSGYFHTLTLGADYKDFSETVSLTATDNDTPVATNTPISYLPFSLGYEGTVQGERSTTQLAALLNFSVRGLADETVECVPGVFLNEFACKRYLGKANYAALRLDLKHTRRFENGWSLFGRVGGQTASGPLISNEQFIAGGVYTVRGYTESAASGDDGLTGGLELRTPSLARQASERLDELILYAFAEGASLRIREPLPGQTDRFDLLAAGLGLRFKGRGGVSGSLDLAYPFEEAGQVEAGDGRVHFRLGMEW